MKKHFFISCAGILMAFLMTSCFGGVGYWIDNPTDESIEVSIDGKKSVTIEANEFKRFDETLKKGEHTMKVGDGEEIKFTFGEKDNHVTLNPTLSTYVIALQEYGIGYASSDNDTIIIIDGKEYEGPFPLVTNAPFIYTGNVNFLINEPFKDEISRSDAGTVIMRKIFRKDDFIDYYKKEYR
jgi:hypothetical protein